MKTYNEHDRRHGSPFDRGSADSYYQRGRSPHHYPNGTGREPRISISSMSPDEIEAYHAGFDENEKNRNFKDYN